MATQVIDVDRLDLSNASEGVVFPSLTEAERDALASVPTGTIVRNSTAEELQVYDGSGWVASTPANQWAANTLRVSLRGDDTTAATSHTTVNGVKLWDSSRPFLTLYAAVTASSAGDTIVVETGTYSMTNQVEPVAFTTIKCDPGVTFSFDTTAEPGFLCQSIDCFTLLGFPDVVAPTSRVGYSFDCSTTPTKDVKLELGDVSGFASGMTFAGDVHIDAGHISSPGRAGGGSNLCRLITFLNCQNGSYLKCKSLTQEDGFLYLGYGTINDHYINIEVSGGISVHMNNTHTSAGSYGMFYHPQSTSSIGNAYFCLRAKTLVATADLGTNLFWNAVRGNNPCRTVFEIDIDHIDAVGQGGGVVSYSASTASGQTEVDVLADTYIKAKTFVYSKTLGFRTWNQFASGIAPATGASPVTARVIADVGKVLRKQVDSNSGTSYFAFSTVDNDNDCESEIILKGGDWVTEGTNNSFLAGTSASSTADRHPVRHQFNNVNVSGLVGGVLGSVGLYRVTGEVTEDNEIEFPYIDYGY